MADLFYSGYATGKLDLQARRFLTAIATAGLPSLAELTPALAREKNVIKPFAPRPAKVHRVENRFIPGPYGEIPIRIYTPDREDPMPVMIYLHGGGWVVGTLDDFDSLCTHLCRDAGYCLVSVDYRLSPEAKFPVAPEECYTALLWVHENHSLIGADPGRIVLGGDSAGGNMAAVIAMMARDRNGPPVRFQLLICPATDLSDRNSDSYHQFGSGIWLPTENMEWYINHYINHPNELTNPYVSPLLAVDLAGLPPAFILTAEFDILRNEAEAYGKRMMEAGVRVVMKRYTGQIHDFILFGRVMKRAAEALADCCRELKEVGVRV